MNLNFLTDYCVPIVIGICLCLGYVLKNVVPSEKVNKYIPLCMAVIGVAVNSWLYLSFDPQILLGGLVSGLASTGLHEAFSQLIKDSAGKGSD